MELATHCNAIVVSSSELPGGDNDTVSTMLRQIWDTETIGVCADSMDDSATQSPLENIRCCQQQYEVGLPWKESYCNVP